MAECHRGWADVYHATAWYRVISNLIKSLQQQRQPPIQPTRVIK